MLQQDYRTKSWRENNFVMKTSFLVLILFVVCSCNNKLEKPLFSADNLPSWKITVDQNTDTVLRTPKGAALKIAKGSFNEAVTLEIKEAYTMKDMLLGGLVTEANGQPLVSGGIIYINAEDGQPVSLLKPITVALPTSYVDPQMQLYTSGPDSINWQEADTLPANPVSTNIKLGEQLFASNCSSCHALDRVIAAPALRGFMQRGNWNSKLEVRKWINNPAKYIPNDFYAKSLQREFGTVMPSFPQLAQLEVNAIIAYIKNEEGNPYDDISWLGSDSGNVENALGYDNMCSDTFYFNDIDTALQSMKVDTAEVFNNDLVSTATDEELTAESMSNLRKGFTDMPSAGAYVFKIQTLGWYNIDAGVHGMKGTMLCDLKVKVTPGSLKDMNVYVMFPKHKDLTVGMMKADNLFHFDKIDGKIPLFPGAVGVAIAFGTSGDDLYVGSTTFTAKRRQQIDVNVQKSSKEAFLQLILSNQIEGINLDIEKQNMKVEIRDCGGNTKGGSSER